MCAENRFCHRAGFEQAETKQDSVANNAPNGIDCIAGNGNAHVKDGIITFADGYHEHIDALDKAAEQDVRCSIRPEEFIICKDGTDGIHGTVQECTYLGLNTHYTIDTDQGDSVEIVEESSIGEGLKKGEKVLLKVKKEKINVFTKDGGTNLIRSDAYEKQ